MDGHILLLFLNHITTIEFYEKTSEMEQPTSVATIRLALAQEKTVTSKRKEFLREIDKRRDPICEHKSASISYHLTTELVQAGQSTTQNWMVSQVCGGSGDDRELSTFSDELYRLPWVATAVPVNSPTSSSTVFLEKPTGHVFCFLPLPLGLESPTGLRVHVHGYFAVDSNRHHLKERTLEQLGKTITDRDLLWNEYLVSQLFPRALVNLVLFVAETAHTDSDALASRDAIFAVIPQLDEVKDQWKPLASGFLKELPHLPVFYSPVNGGHFLSADEVLFDGVEDNTPIADMIRRLLHQNGTNLVSVPEFVIDQLGPAAARVTASLVCTAIRNTDRDLLLTDDNRTILLQYLADNLEDKTELVGTRLLAIADGSWMEFTSCATASPVFVDSPDHSRSLLPVLDRLFVRNDVVDICREIISTTDDGEFFCAAAIIPLVGTFAEHTGMYL